MIVHWDVQQNTPEWDELRRGKLTASSLSEVVAPAKLGISKSSQALALRLIDASLGNIKPDRRSYEMDRGHELEPKAAAWYQYTKGIQLKQVGFVERDNGLYGCSPDRLIMSGDKIESGLEIKCLMLPNHIKGIESDKIPGDHWLQCQGQMIACECDSWVYLAHHPNCKKQFIKIVERDESTEKIESAINEFLSAMQELKRLYIL